MIVGKFVTVIWFHKEWHTHWRKSWRKLGYWLNVQSPAGRADVSYIFIGPVEIQLKSLRAEEYLVQRKGRLGAYLERRP